MPEQIPLLPLTDTKASAAMFRVLSNALCYGSKSWADFGVDLNNRPAFMTVELRVNGVEVSFERLVSHMEAGLDEAWQNFEQEVRTEAQKLVREKADEFARKLDEWTESVTSELGTH